MGRLKKRLLAIITSLTMVLGIISVPGVSYANNEPATSFTVENYDSTQNKATYTIGATTITARFQGINPQGVIDVGGDQPSQFVDKLNAVLLGIQGQYNPDTMEAAFVAEDGFEIILEYSVLEGGYPHFELPAGFNGGFPTGQAITFTIRQKNNNNGGGGNRPNVQINMSSTNTEWQGQPAVHEDYYQYNEGTDTITWNYARQNSWKYCSVSVNNLGDTARFDEGSPTKTINYNPKAAPNQNKVDVTFSFSWSFRPANNYVTINGVNYPIPLDFNSKGDWLDAFAFEYQNQSIYFTIEDVELADSTVNTDRVLNINMDLRPVNMGECYIGNFLWRSTPSREGADDYVPHAKLTLISATYPRDIEDGRSFDEATLLADSRLTKDQKTAKYITYGVDENGNGEMVLPAGTKVTMRVAPEFGYQVTAFKVNGQSIENANNASFTTETDVAVFTFTIGYANFHLGADVLQVGNEAVTDGAHDISDAGVELSADESSMSIGTAKLEVEDAVLADGQAELFENAADNGFELAGIVDISLYNTVYKGTSSSSWDTPVKNLTNPATIYLALDGDYSGKNIEIIHEKEIGSYEVLEGEYIEEYNVIAFETTSFSNYAIAYGDGPIKKHIPEDAKKNVPEGYDMLFRMYNPNSGEHFYTTSRKEGNKLVDAGWNYEGEGWIAPKDGKPVYRLYNKNSGDHHYTMSERERRKLVEVGWKDEGIGWYSDSENGKPLYRLYNPNTEVGQHHYTTSNRERKKLIAAGWNDEGIAWYGYAD